MRVTGSALGIVEVLEHAFRVRVVATPQHVARVAVAHGVLGLPRAHEARAEEHVLREVLARLLRQARPGAAVPKRT